jgi:hypothetical protein
MSKPRHESLYATRAADLQDIVELAIAFHEEQQRNDAGRPDRMTRAREKLIQAVRWFNEVDQQIRTAGKRPQPTASDNPGWRSVSA